jgi:hypothetical protein
MNIIEALGFAGFVFAATSFAAIAYENRMDVLRTSCLKDCAEVEPRRSARPLWTPSIIDRLRWRVEGVIDLASSVTG